MSKELCYRSATELAMMIKSKDISSQELTQVFIDRIEEHDKKINAVVVRTFEKHWKVPRKPIRLSRMERSWAPCTVYQ